MGFPPGLPLGTAGIVYDPDHPQWLRQCRSCGYQWIVSDYKDTGCPACKSCGCGISGGYCIGMECVMCGKAVFTHRNTEVYRKQRCEKCLKKYPAIKEVTATSNKEADFTSVSMNGETVGYNGKDTVYRIVTAGKDGSLGIQGKDHNALMNAIERAEGRKPAPQAVAPRPAQKAIAAPQLRIGDTERNKVLDALNEHMAQGRIDLNEFQERSDKALAAKSQSQLDKLLADLPATGVVQRTQETVLLEDASIRISELNDKCRRQATSLKMQTAVTMLCLMLMLLAMLGIL